MEVHHGSYAIGVPEGARDLDALVRLVGAYRTFYEAPPDDAAVRAFVRDRLERGDTQFFVARESGGRPIAFAHLMPSLDSLALQTIGILEDIYVDEAHRRAGLGGALLDAAERYAREHRLSRLTLSTAHKNRTAQRLYLSRGYVPDQRFRAFNRVLVEEAALAEPARAN